MSAQFFRTKKGLHLTPQDTEPTGLELGDLWMDAEGTLKRWDGTSSQDVGSGGVGSVDIMFADTFDATNISEYTTTGTVAVTDNVLEVIQGKKSLKITHTGGASAERIIPVDIKFRNKNVTFSFDVESDAASGNLTLTVIDNTNTVTLVNAESIQPQGDLDTSIKRSVSFTIPDDCEELKYTFNAVSETDKISIIDNVVVELTQTAKLSTTIEVPVITDEVDAGAITIGAVTTAPTKGTTSTDKVFWHREGQFLVATYRYAQTSAGSSAGSGDYLLSIPNNLQVDTTQVVPYTGAISTNISQRSIIGTGARWDSGPTHGVMYPILYSSTQFRIRTDILYSSVSFMSSSNTPLNLAGVTFTVNIKVPIVGWSATETQEVSLAQAVLKQESDSVLHVASVLGYGSTNTKVVRFDPAKIQKSLGTAITYIPSATLGDSFKINEAGVYQINTTVAFTTTTGAAFPYIVKNPTNLAQSNSGLIPQNEVIAHSYTHGGASGNPDMPMAANVYLEKDDVIWVINPVASPVALTTGDNRSYMQITKVGALKQVNVTENQKIEIPTSELRMEGASTRGTGSDTAIVRFDNIAKLRGDAFEVVSNATVGTVITMKKKGKLDISTSLVFPVLAQFGISLNQSNRTTTSLPSSEALAGGSQASGGNAQNVSTNLTVNIGDIIRIYASAAPSAGVNALNLSFQEQEVAVSVTNVLPQFSESDSSVRVDTANGYGSTATKIRRFSNVRDNLGSAITYVPSATDGDSFRVNEDGVYNISYTDNFNAASSVLGISKNASSLITDVDILTVSEILALQQVTGTDEFRGCASWQGYLQKNDVIRAHSRGQANLVAANTTFTISKVGKPNVTGVDVTPFAGIEYEVTDEFYAVTHAGYALTYTPYFSTVLKNSNNGVISVSNNSTTGLRITALKRCKINVSFTHGPAGSGNRAFGLIKNDTSSSPILNAALQDKELALSVTILGDSNTVSSDVILEAGETITPRTDYTGAPSATDRCMFTVTATELRDAYQVIGGGVENTYSARIASGATIESESYPFITSVTSGGTGLYNITYVSGFFNGVIPKVAPTAESSTLPNAPITAAVLQGTSTANGVTIRVSQGGTAINFPFVLDVQRQGSDYRTPSKAIGLPQQRIAVLRDQKSGVAGGSSTTSYTARVLNTLEDPTGIIVNAASFTGTGGTNTSIILNPGRYEYTFYSPGYSGAVENNKARLRTTDGITLGVSTNNRNAANGHCECIGTGLFTLTSQKTIELQHITTTAVATQGLGVLYSTGDVDVYARVVFRKIEE